MTIPSRDRKGGEEDARLYGAEYYSLEDAIIEMLVEETMGRKMGEEMGVGEG